jgi:hypothetical protein
MLQRTHGFGRVHCLIIDCVWPQDDSDGSHPRDQRPCINITAEERGYRNRLFNGPQRHVFKSDIMPAMATYKTNDAWKPLASLLQKLPALMDLRYGFPGQFPPCLLEALHKYLPRCRLHINTFKLRSLNAPSTDPYELMLATSPSLTSIRVECDMQHCYITKHIPNFNYEAVQRMVGGLAPNLKELQIFHADWEANLDSYLPSKAWRGLTSSDQIESSRPVSGSLRCLEIDVGHAVIEPQLIETWKAHTDFSI